MKRALMTLSGIIVLFAAATSFAGVCGDANNNGVVNIQDITHLINFLYKGGAAPIAELRRHNDRHRCNIYHTIR